MPQHSSPNTIRLNAVGRVRLLMLVLTLWAAADRPAAAQERDAFVSQFRQFAERHCVACHGPDIRKRKLRLDTLPATFADKDVAATWEKVLDRMARSEMPPKERTRPPERD